jgi:hypothetical protein
MSKEAMKLALEALYLAVRMEPSDSIHECPEMFQEAITALRNELAKQEQGEPYGYLKLNTGKFVNDVEGLNPMKDNRYLPLYTKAQPKQEQGEPVAWGVIASNTGRLCQVELDFAEVEDLSPKWVMPLYTTPQQRTWVGLMDEEIDYQAKKYDHGFYFALGALWAEAKLKEKNNA